MNEVPTQEAPKQGLDQLHEADKAHLEAVRTLGQVAESHSLQPDSSGNLLTPKEQAHERQFVAENGHGSNETSTSR